MDYLCILLVVLALVTVVGRGIWAAMAYILRSLTGTLPPEQRLALPRHQPEEHPEATQTRPLDEISIALRQIRGLLARDELDEETADRLIDLLNARRQVLLGETRTPPQPATPPPIETVRMAPMPLPAPITTTPSEEVILEVLPADAEPTPAEAPALALEAIPPPQAPTRPFTNVLASFMEERNILWGELVGGLLIVGCSIALVLTLWQSLQAVPYFPFLLFSTLTGSLFAAGQYTLHHWKLASTSRGLLLIALLLVPLNLLILADLLSRGEAITTFWIDALVAVGAVGAFTGLVRIAGRDLIGTDLLPGPVDRRWLLCLAVIGSTGSQLLAPAILGPPADGAPPTGWVLLAGAAVVCLLVACSAVLGGFTLYGARDLRLGRSHAHAIFSFLGLGTFALASTLGYLVTRLAEPANALPALASPLVLAGIPGIALGLLVTRRLADDQPIGLRVTGTAVALAGLAVMLGGVALAWPTPQTLVLTLALTGAVLMTAAFAAQVSWAHAASVPALSVAGVLTFHLLVGELSLTESSSAVLWRVLPSANSGAVLAGIVAVWTALAARLSRSTMQEQGQALGRAAFGVGVAALFVVTMHGMDRPLTAALVHGACVVVAGLASLRWRRAHLAAIAGILIVPGTLWALWGIVPVQREWWGLTLAAEALALVLASLWLARQDLDDLAVSGARTGLFAGALAVIFAILAGNFAYHPAHTATALLLSSAMLAWAIAERNAWWFTGFQVGLTMAMICAVSAVGEPRGWLEDQRGMQAQGIGLALLSLGWVLARRRWPGDRWHAFSPGVDRLSLGFLVLAQVFLGCACAFAGIFTEWGAAQLTDVAPDLHYIYGPTGWSLLSVLAVALLAVLRSPPCEEEQAVSFSAQIGLMLLFVTMALLWAGMHIADLAGASALRWGLAICFLIGSLVTWQRQRAFDLATSIGLAPVSTTTVSYSLFGFTAGIVVFLTAILTGLGFSGLALPGPIAGSLFAKIGSVISSISPLALVVVGLVGTAVRERWTGYALAAGLLSTVSSMGGYALGVVQAGGVVDRDQALFTVLLGCQVAAFSGLAWLAGRRLVGAGLALAVQGWLGLLGLFALVLFHVPTTQLNPFVLSAVDLRMLGGSAAWLALLLATAAASWHAIVERRRWRFHAAGLGLLIAGLLAGNFAAAWDSATSWVSYHVMVGFWGILAIGLTTAGSCLPAEAWRWRGMQPVRMIRLWLVVLAILLTFLALRGAWDDLVFAWVPPAAALAASLLLGAMALWFLRGGHAHASGVLFTLAVFLGWVEWGPKEPALAWLTIAAGLSASACFWWAIEMPWLRAGQTYLRSRVAYAPLATTIALGLVTLVALFAIVGDAVGTSALRTGPFGWAAALLVGIALRLAVQGGYARLALPGIYVFGLTLLGLMLHALEPTPAQLRWMGTLALAIHVLAASLVVRIWQSHVTSPEATPSELRLPYPTLPSELGWLIPAQVSLGSVVLGLSLIIAVNEPTVWLRLTGGLALALLVPACWLMARALPERRAEEMRLVALALVVLALGGIGWALPDPLGAVPWLTRNAWLLLVLTACSGMGLEWLRGWPGGRRLALVVAGLAVILVLVLLGQMIPVFDPITRRTPLPGLPVGAVALAIGGLIAVSLRLALCGDPLGSSERGRMTYVFLAEVLLLCLFGHARLNVPEMFVGPLVRFWPFIVLGIAFVGVGLGEWAQRRGLKVLAFPLSQTGVFLPLVPILAFWARPPAALLAYADNLAPGMRPFLGYLEKMPQHFESHAFIWFITSALYAAIALARRSTLWALIAALAANFGFWALLMYGGISFFLHPQAWLIPLALIVLVAEYLHRDQLSEPVGEGLRYLGISMIYVASTTDMFLVGLGNSLWLPVVLAVLCVLGVLAGIVLRIRAFLFLGVGFLLVDVLSMIWHAAVHQAHTWVWWVSGIILGIAILALFALFEKRRTDVMRLLDELRSWN